MVTGRESRHHHEHGALGELFDRIVSGLRDAYGLDCVTLSLFDPQHELRHLSGSETLTSAVIEDRLVISDKKCGQSTLAATAISGSTTNSAPTAGAMSWG